MKSALNTLGIMAGGVVFAAEDAGMRQVAAPQTFPAVGIYEVVQRITLTCATPGSRIYYTTDGSTPTVSSAQFDPYKLILIDPGYDGDKGLRKEYQIRAFAVKEGMRASDIAEFHFVIQRRDKSAYVWREVHPGLHMIADFDDDKMFLVIGSQKALLIDGGMGSGALLDHVKSLVGNRPLDVVITHAHPDHIARVGEFQPEHDVYMNLADLPMLTRFAHRSSLVIDQAVIKDVKEGFVFDLGDRQFKVLEVPGHSPGSIVLFDEANGILIAGDAVGSNKPTFVDAAWLQMPGMALIDEFLNTLRLFRPKVRGKVREIYTGHNDAALIGETYLDNLERAAQNLVEHGESVLTPSLRPTDVWQIVEGDRITDPNWAAINVNRARFLSSQPEVTRA